MIMYCAIILRTYAMNLIAAKTTVKLTYAVNFWDIIKFLLYCSWINRKIKWYRTATSNLFSVADLLIFNQIFFYQNLKLITSGFDSLGKSLTVLENELFVSNAEVKYQW